MARLQERVQVVLGMLPSVNQRHNMVAFPSVSRQYFAGASTLTLAVELFENPDSDARRYRGVVCLSAPFR